MKPKIVVVGCGVVGAMVAYELNRSLSADIVVVDKRQPGQGSTGAALGVLMGIISQKVKGRTWRLREASVRRYGTLIEELREQGQVVPFNSQGIVSLCFDEQKLPRWESLKEKRRAQGWPLEIWDPATLKSRCPQVALDSVDEKGDIRTVKAAIYSPADRQVHPAKLTEALVAAAAEKGVTFHWNAEVTKLIFDQTKPLSETQDSLGASAPMRCRSVQTTQGEFEADWVVVCAGLGSAALTDVSPEPLALMPVLGQAMEIELPEMLGDRTFQPVINGDDIQFVPLGNGRYWLGATVEFPPENNIETPASPDPEGLDSLQRGAAQFCGAIAQAKIIKTWNGLRPRPVGQPAPVIKPLANTNNVTLATGHYRNGVLLAPATAQQVCEQLRAEFP